MNKELFSIMSQIQALDNDPCVVAPDPEVRSDSDLNRVLDSIFDVDETTGLPRTDIQYYLSPDGNPQVREWLVNNLMKPRADSNRSSVDGVTDDLLFEFQRKPDEELDDYRARIYQIGVEAREYLNNHPKE